MLLRQDMIYIGALHGITFNDISYLIFFSSSFHFSLLHSNQASMSNAMLSICITNVKSMQKGLDQISRDEQLFSYVALWICLFVFSHPFPIRKETRIQKKKKEREIDVEKKKSKSQISPLDRWN